MKRFCAICMMLVSSSVVLCATGGASFGADFLAQIQRTSGAEVIVKFAAETEARTAVEEVLAGNEQATDRVNAHTEFLSEQIDVPLAFKQITSGREVLYAIDSDAVVARVIESVESRADVHSAEAEDGEAGPLAFTSGPSLIVDLMPGSELARRISDPATDAGGELQRFAETVGEGVGYGLKAEVLENYRIRLAIDMGRLMATVAERLNQRSDIDYAQPNFMLQPFPNPG